MKIAYLFFAYRNPELMRRTIERLTSEDAAFFVHIDAKVDVRQFDLIRAFNVFFTETRIPVYWAEFSGVEAILLLIREALAQPQRYDYFVLMSGSEYPLHSREYIHRFFTANRGREFITMVKVPGPGKPLSRINTIVFPSTRPVLKFLFRALAKFGLGRRDYRRHARGLEPYSGITWWALSREACEFISEFTDRDKRLAAFLRTTFAPEEVFVHTILGNSPFKARMRRGLLYEDWTGQIAHPAMISERHLAAFEGQEQITIQDLNGPGELLFARKFSDGTLHLADRVDDMIRRKERQHTSLMQAVR